MGATSQLSLVAWQGLLVDSKGVGRPCVLLVLLKISGRDEVLGVGTEPLCQGGGGSKQLGTGWTNFTRRCQ